MSRNLVLSDEEAGVLEELLRAEVTADYTELRRTRNPEYRDRLQRRRELAERLLEVLTGTVGTETR